MHPPTFAWSLRRAGALAAACALSLGAGAQFVPAPVQWDPGSEKESWISVSGARISVDGSKATYQQIHQHHRRGFGGVDAFRWKRYLDENRVLTVDGRILRFDEEYRLAARYENTAAGMHLEGGWRESRVFYDGTGGYLPTNGQWFVPFNPALATDRGEFWLEGGIESEKLSAVVRYAHQYRSGTKDATTWGDTNLTGIAGATGTRAIVPAFHDLDEERDTLTLDVEYRPDENTIHGAGLRLENWESDNRRNMRRRPEEAADRYLTQREVNDADLFALHGFTHWRRSERLTLSAAAAHTTIDTNFSGSRIYGATYDAVFDPSFTRRQQRDEGFADLEGDAHWRQTLVTANALYRPARHWSLSGGLRYENQRQETVADVLETNVGGAPGFVTEIHDLAGDGERHFDELLASLEADYTGVKNLVWSFSVEASSGDGNLREDLVEADTGEVDLGRDTDFGRDAYKVGAAVRWYPTTSFNGAVGVYRKVRDNDYDTTDDTTPNIGGGDRYPAYVVAQKFTTDDLYVRGTWRPVNGVSVVGRYDYQDTEVDSREDGLPGVTSATMTTHVFSGAMSWMPASSVVLQGSINYVYDEIVTGAADSPQPLARVAGRFDNNYRTFTLLAIFVLDDATDLQVDATYFRADNHRDFAEVTLPFGLSARDRTFGATVNRRISEDMLVGLRYARADYDNTTAGGFRDFTADLIYGRLQLRF